MISEEAIGLAVFTVCIIWGNFVDSFSIVPAVQRHGVGIPTPLFADGIEADFDTLDDDQKKKVVGNLVADDEWQGLGMELSEIVRVSVMEDIKKNAAEFLDKEEYKVGDITKEIDSRVKDKVAEIRGKEEYELGDFVCAMDDLSKSMAEEITGKEYEMGDLTKELDQRVKNRVAEFAGKDSYEVGDLSSAINDRIMDRVGGFTGKEEYEFGDVAREVENQRKEWVKDFLGEDAAKDYLFGDITAKAVLNFTGKEEYQVGDISKKIFGDLFGKKK